MPAYNAASFLEEAIEDILAQTETDFELICVDDGSVDNSADIIKKYCATDKRVKLVRQKNSGGGAARNAGLKVATGKYLLFLDADDRFESSLFKLVYDKAEELDAEVVVFGGDLFDYTTGEIRRHPELLDISVLSEESLLKGILTEEDKQNKLFQFTNTTVWNKLIKKEFVVKNEIFFQEIYVVDTLFFTMMVLFSAKHIGYLNKEFVHYRCGNPEGQLANHDKNPNGAYDALACARSF